MAKEIKLTQESLDAYKEELEYLKTTRADEVAEQLKEARSFGDLSENAEYDAAKNEQARIEGEIVEIEAKLKIAEIIKTDGGHGVVNVGSKVKILDDLNEETEYEIVGTTEADISVGRISNESPLGKALIGAKLGDTVTVNGKKYTVDGMVGIGEDKTTRI